MYNWIYLRKTLLPTAQQAIDAMARADENNVSSRDQRMLMAALMRLTRVIPRIGSNLNTRKTALTAFSWAITPDDPALAEEAARVTTRLAPTIQKLLGWHTDTIAFGASLVKLKAESSPTLGNVLSVDKRYLPTEIERPAGIADASQLFIVEDSLVRTITPLEKLMMEAPQSYLAEIDDNYEPGGLLRDLLLKGIAAVMMEKEWTNTARKVKGILEVIYAPDSSPEDVNNAVVALQDAVNKNISSHSSDTQLKMTDISNSGAALATFSQFLARLDADFSIKILGQANTTQLPNSGGSRAALQILQMITADISWSDIQRTTALINKLLLFDYQLNKDSSATLPPWRFSIAIPEATTPEAISRVIQTMLASGVPLLASEVYNAVGFRNPDPALTVISNTTQFAPV